MLAIQELRHMMECLSDDLRVEKCRIEFSSGMVLEINETKPAFSGMVSDSPNMIAKTVKL